MALATRSTVVLSILSGRRDKPEKNRMKKQPERDAWIRERLAEGISLERIAAACRISQEAVRCIVQKLKAEEAAAELFI